MANENKYEIERLEGRGITGLITDNGCRYTTYDKFAVASGYPEAVGHRKPLPNGSEVEVLAKGNHELDNVTIYVVQHGDTRHLIGERGIKITEAKYEMKLSKEKSQEIFTGLVGMLYRNLVAEQNLVSYERDNVVVDGFNGMKYSGEFTVTLRFNRAKLPTPKPEKSPQQLRDEIVERAKRDIAELKNGNYYDLHDAEEPEFPFNCKAEFIVNNNKRTVVVLLKGAGSGIVRAKGIAKCTPSDCFNVHIGKAIALRRALGLEVPAEYLNAPHPTEVRVGDVVETFISIGQPHRTFIVNGYWSGDTTKLQHDGWTGFTPFEPECGDRIIDDSREQ